MQYATSLLSMTRHHGTLLPLIHLVLLKPLAEKVCTLRKQAIMRSKMGNHLKEMTMRPVSLRLPEQTLFCPDPDVVALDRNYTQE